MKQKTNSAGLDCMYNVYVYTEAEEIWKSDWKWLFSFLQLVCKFIAINRNCTHKSVLG